MQSTLELSWVNKVARNYVHSRLMSEAVSLALASGMHLVLSGPGGHAKSQFLRDVFGAIDGIEPYVKSLHQGTTVDDLYGGLDFDALSRPVDRVLQFNLEASFMSRGIAVFEEGFDAPPRVLGSLKDTITAREFSDGVRKYKLSTKLIVIATNHSPRDIADRGVDVQALVERFPIQLEVTWPSYDAESFLELLDTVDGAPQEHSPLVHWDQILELQELTAKVQVGALVKRVLAGVVAELRKDKVVISPRTAVYAMNIVKAAAAINGRDYTVPEDVDAVVYLPGCQPHRRLIADTVRDLVETMGAVIKAQELQGVLAELTAAFTEANSLVAWRELKERVQTSLREARELKGGANMRAVITQLRDEFQELDRSVDSEIAHSPLTLQDKMGQLEEIEDNLRRLKNRMETREVEALRAVKRELAAVLAELDSIMPVELMQSRHADLKKIAVNHMGTCDLKIKTFS